MEIIVNLPEKTEPITYGDKYLIPLVETNIIHAHFKMPDGEVVPLLPWAKNYYVASFGLHEELQEKVLTYYHEQAENQDIPLGEGLSDETLAFIRLYLPKQVEVMYCVWGLLALEDKEVEAYLFELFKNQYSRFWRMRGPNNALMLGNVLAHIQRDMLLTTILPALVYAELTYQDEPRLNGKVTKQQVQQTSTDDLMVEIFKNMYQMLLSIREVDREKTLSEVDIKEALRRYQQLTGTKIAKEQMVDEILETLESKTFKEIPRSRFTPFTTVRNNVYKEKTYRHFKRMSVSVNLSGVQEFNLFGQIPYTRNDYLRFYADFLQMKKLERLTDDEFAAYFAERLIVFSLTYALKEAGDLVVKRNQLTYRVKNEQKRVIEGQKEVEKAQHRIKQQEMLFNQQKQQLEEEKERMQQEIAQLQKQVARLNQQVDEQKGVVKEVAQLREIVFSKEDEVANETDKEVKVNPNWQVAYFGGHPATIQKLRAELPNVKHIPPEALSVDLSFVDRMDVCIFDTTYNNHSNYARFKRVSTEVPVLYVTKGTSSKRLLEMIDETLS